MTRKMREKAAEFHAAHAERKLTISVIERLWGESRVISDDILKRLYTELTNTSGEQELIQEKNALSEDGIRVRNKGKQERRIQTIHRVVAVNQSVLKVGGEGKAGEKQRKAEIIPPDEYLRIRTRAEIT